MKSNIQKYVNLYKTTITHLTVNTYTPRGKILPPPTSTTIVPIKNKGSMEQCPMISLIDDRYTQTVLVVWTIDYVITAVVWLDYIQVHKYRCFTCFQLRTFDPQIPIH